MPFSIKPGQIGQSLGQDSIEDIRARKIEQVKAEYWRRRDGGVLCNGHWFRSDQVAQSEYNSMMNMTMAAKAPDSYVIREKWKCLDDSHVDMTFGLLKALMMAGAKFFFILHDVKEAHIAALQASDDPAAYDITASWPKIFGE